MARMLRNAVIALLLALAGCDDAASGEPACDGSACAKEDTASAPGDAAHAGGHDSVTGAPTDSGSLTDKDASESPAAADGGDTDGDDAATPAPEVACEADSECGARGDAGECKQPKCIDGACGVIADDDALPDDDGNPCTEESCNAGSARHQAEPVGTACNQDGGDYCDGDGACVECVLPSQCDSDVCQDGECRPAPCGNGMLDTGETDVDCGGGCGGCGPDELCAVDADCLGNECPAGTCVPNCDDGVLNHGESAVDCGAVCPSALCADGAGCGAHDDCDSGFCNPTSTECATPSCSDGIQNGTEASPDCGGVTNGVTCPACQVACTDNWECGDTALCYDGFCTDEVNGCTIANSMDLTNKVAESQSAPITIDFGGVLGSSYSPRCIKVTMGSKIRFAGTFSGHPLLGGIVDGTKQPASTGPFTTLTNTGSSKDFVLDDCAAYPYYCNVHAGSGMTGAVIVLLP